jgi:DNA-binding response OmpR family regulator
MAKIVIAEDDPEQSSLIKNYLLNDNHEVLLAADAAQLYVLLKHSIPDAILLDFQMPGGGAPGAVKSIRGNPSLSMIPILILSSMPLEHQKKWLGEVSRIDFLAKPFKASELSAAVEKLLRS